MEKMNFQEFIAQCDVSHWKIENCTPEVEYRKGKYVVVRVIPAEDPDFEIREDLKEELEDPEVKAVVDWGQPVALLDDPYQSCYTIFRRSGNMWKCVGELYPTLEEAIEEIEYLTED